MELLVTSIFTLIFLLLLYHFGITTNYNDLGDYKSKAKLITLEGSSIDKENIYSIIK